MTHPAPFSLRRFATGEAGAVTVEFVILFPLLIMLLMMAFELGMVNMRHMMLSRATDLAVRDVRIGVGPAPDFETFRSEICEKAMIIPNCKNVIRIEMNSLKRDKWTTVNGAARCVNKIEEIKPETEFVHGEENELMLIRVCALFDPVFPTSGLGRRLPTDAEGRYGVVVTSGFVNEPDV